jgi:hypothetical protein
LRYVANGYAIAHCYGDAGAQTDILKQWIPAGDTVMADVEVPPEVWLTLIPRNQVYRYIAVQGHSAGGVPIRSRYGDSFKWLVLSSDLEQVRPHWADPADASSREYFRQLYTPVSIVEIPRSCLEKGLARYSEWRNNLHIYVRRSRPIAEAPQLGR